jgi:RimJ/RimL family protein N-acetyltransferase
MTLPVLKTNRLTLRPLSLDDANRVVELVGDFEVSKMLSVVPHPYAREDAVWWISQTAAFAEGGERAFAIEDESGLIGAISVGRAGPEPDFGYWLGKAYWGRGYMSEAARAVLAWHFGEAPETTVLSGALNENPASLNVLRKLGFHKPHSIRLPIRARGEDLPATQVRLTFKAFRAEGHVTS